MSTQSKSTWAARKQLPATVIDRFTAGQFTQPMFCRLVFGQRWACLLLLAVLAPVGCGTPEAPAVPAPKAPAAAPEAPVNAPAAEASIPESSEPLTAEAPEMPPVAVKGISSKLKFKGADGEVSFSVKPESDGAKLVDADEKEIARFTVDQNKLKIKDAADVVLGYVVVVDGHFKIKNAEQTEELFKLQMQSDGDWKLEDGGGKLIYKIKKRDYGFEIEDDNDNSLSKAKLKSGKTSLRNTAEETVLYTKDKINTLAFACMGLEAVKSQPLQAGLMTMVILHSR